LKLASGILRSKITIFLFLVFLFYNFIFNSYTGQFLFDTLNPKFHSGDLKGEIKRFSLLSGLEIENLVLTEKKSINDPFLKLGRFAFIYSLPSLLIGSIHIQEIGLDSIMLVIKKKDSKYNFETIFPVVQEKEKAIENQSIYDSIYTALYIKFFSFINIRNFSISYEDEDVKLRIEDISLQFLLETKRLNTLYFDERSLELIKNLEIDIQPTKFIQTEFQFQNLYFKDQIGFHLNIHANGNEVVEWSQTALFELKDLTPKLFNQSQPPLNLKISFSTELSKSKLNLKELLFVFQGLRFIEGNGTIENIFDLKSKIFFHLTNSNIDLDILYKSIESFKLPIPILSGNIRLSPLEINGNLEDFTVLWSPELLKVNAKLDQKNHSFSTGKFQTQIQMGIQKKDSEKKIHLETASIEIENLRYNTLFLNSKVQFKNKLLLGNIDVQNINLNQFEKSIQGNLELNLNIEESSLSSIIISMKSKIKNFQIPIDIYNLKPSNLIVQTDLKISLDESYHLLKVILMSTKIDLLSYRIGSTLKVDSGNILYDNVNQKLKLENLHLKFYPEKMVDLLPYTLGEKLLTISPYLGNEVSINSNLNIQINHQKQLYGVLESKLPGIQLNDLYSKFNLDLNSDGKETIHIKEFLIDGFDKRFSTTLTGKIFKNKSSSSPDLNLSFSFLSETKKSILSGIDFKGKLGTQIHIQESGISGSFSSENSNLYYQKGNCSGKECKFFQILNWNCSIPILHEVNSKSNVSILDGNKETLIQTKGMDKENNFFIESISTNHPIYPEKEFTLIEGNSKNFGMMARVDYISNLFSLSNLSIKTLNGSIGSKNIQVNIADGDPTHFEFLGNLQVRDIDLTELIPKENKKNIDDGKIRGDVNFSGRNLKDIIDNTDIYFSIYKIGKDFGKSAINIVSPPNLIRDYIVSSYSVDRIETELTKGLIYVNVLFKPSILSNLLTKIENNRLSMERMPLTNFINRAENEISKYK
jgi:hypothetical protein